MTAVVALSASGMATGRRLAEGLGARLHGRGAAADAALSAADYAPRLRALFAAGEAIVFVGALGALVRMLAPLLADKAAEPPVVAVAEDGSAVIPVLGGHRGANDLARRAAALLGVAPAVTTASDLALGVALDEPPAGWDLAAGAPHKEVASRLLAGEAVRVEGDIPWLDAARIERRADARLVLRASHRAPAPGGEDGDDGLDGADGGRLALTYRPRTLALGVGCERGTDPGEAVALARRTLAEAGLAAESVALVASIDLKADEPAVHAVAAALGRPARFLPAERLERETPRLASPSETVFRAVGAHGVAEAAALAAAGADGSLAVPKRRSRRATCAVALAPAPIDPAGVGVPRGRLFVVGTGPGRADWRTAETERLVGAASDLVGYRLYLDLLGPLAAGKALHPFPLGAERERAAAALDLAAGGRTVALVSSGDPGVYAMASLVCELLDTGGRADWRRVETAVAPGVSALQACAARIGAPLGHDFCAVSLSDLLTPAAEIERRLRAAAEGDFVAALYNPASGRRRAMLDRALEIFRAARPPATPVVHCRAVGRPEERIEVSTLADFDPAPVDMLSLPIVGSARTRVDGGRVYTPRGYAVSRAGGPGA